MLLRLGPSIVPITLILGGQRLRMPSAAAVLPGSSARGRVSAGSVPGALECACWAGRTCEARLYMRFSCAAQAKIAKGTVGSVPLAYEPRAQFRLSPFYVSAPNALWPLTPAGLRPAPFAALNACRPASFAALNVCRPASFVALRSHQPGRFEPRKAFRCGFGAARRGAGLRGTTAGVSGTLRCIAASGGALRVGTRRCARSPCESAGGELQEEVGRDEAKTGEKKREQAASGAPPGGGALLRLAATARQPAKVNIRCAAWRRGASSPCSDSAPASKG
jgi:hypothetical protein